METEQLISEWKKSFINDKKSIRNLSKLSNIEITHPFFSELVFDAKKIIAQVGLGYNKLNKLVINLIAYSFGEVLKKNNQNKMPIDILVCSDGSSEVKDFLSDIADVFAAQKITTTAFKFYNGYDKKFICRTIKRLELNGSIFIERSIYNNEVFNIYFINGDGASFEEKFIKDIKLETKKQDIFQIPIKKAKIDFLSNNKVINDYIDKILTLSSRKGDQKKMKIAISNYNNGVTEILEKILGNMDFNYIINKKINYGNIHAKNKRNDQTYLNFYWKDIAFAIKNRCGMVICPSRNGTALNLFIINGRQVFHLDANEVTLMFLNFFLNDLRISNKNILNSYVSTDISPINSIKNLINKYQLELSISEDLKSIDEKYLLFYWNQNSEFVFGENKMIEFGLHHLMVRFLEMVNYYKTQRLNITSQRNMLVKMYGNYKTHALIFKFGIERLNFWLNNIQKFGLNIKYPIENVVMFDNINNFNEHLIARIMLKNEIELFVKFNFINQKIIVFIQLENEDSKFWTKNFIFKNSFIKNINSIIKKDLKIAF